jgi:peptidoglycan-associated lipoprotein
MTTHHACLSWIGLTALLLAFGCASNHASTPPAAPEPEPEAATAPIEQPRARDTLELEAVYFDTDRAALRPEARERLKEYAEAIRANPGWGVVTVEGHCDERGSDGYNVALGQNRAGAVAQYLEELGVPSARLQTRSYGESRPAVEGHDEGAWRKNRRAEIRARTDRLAQRD